MLNLIRFFFYLLSKSIYMNTYVDEKTGLMLPSRHFYRPPSPPPALDNFLLNSQNTEKETIHLDIKDRESDYKPTTLDSKVIPSEVNTKQFLNNVINTEIIEPREKLIVKPAQSGKTAIIIKLIKEQYGIEENDNYRTINFVFNSNNLLLNKQTGKRFKKDCTGAVCRVNGTVIFSSSKSADVKTWKELVFMIDYENASNIMVCNNKQRVNDIPKVIEHLLRGNRNYRINIWVDEADKFVGSIRDFSNLVEFNTFINLWCITATPEKLFHKFGKQNVFRLKETTADDYHGWIDNNVNIRQPSKDTLDFIRIILNETTGIIIDRHLEKLNEKQDNLLKIINRLVNNEGIVNRSNIIKNIDEIGFTGKTPSQSLSAMLQKLRDKKYISFMTPGTYKLNLWQKQDTVVSGSSIDINNTRWFIPGERKKETHIKIKNLCIQYGFAVFIVNGDGIELTIPGKPVIDIIEKVEELNTILINLTEKYNLNNFPVVVTGNLCISRGISIQSPKWLFTHAILSHCVNRSEVSQTAGRLNGNIKSWVNYTSPIVYTTQEFNDIAIEVENQSRELAKLAWGKDGIGNSTSVTVDEFNSLTPNYKLNELGRKDINYSNRIYKIFKDIPSIKEFGNKFLNKKFSVSNKAPHTLINNGANPSIAHVLNRWWGLGGGRGARCVCTNEDCWVVYWNKNNYPDAPGIIYH